MPLRPLSRTTYGRLTLVCATVARPAAVSAGCFRPAVTAFLCVVAVAALACAWGVMRWYEATNG